VAHPTIQQIVILREIERSGEANAYSLFRATNGRKICSVALPSAYRIINGLLRANLITQTRTETASRNRMPMPFYALTDEGRAVLRSVQEALA